MASALRSSSGLGGALARLSWARGGVAGLASVSGSGDGRKAFGCEAASALVWWRGDRGARSCTTTAGGRSPVAASVLHNSGRAKVGDSAPRLDGYSNLQWTRSFNKRKSFYWPNIKKTWERETPPELETEVDVPDLPAEYAKIGAFADKYKKPEGIETEVRRFFSVARGSSSLVRQAGCVADNVQPPLSL